MIIKMYYVEASTCVIEVDKNLKIAIDPALAPLNHQIEFSSFKSVRVREPKYQESIFKNINIWLITYSHEDHIDLFGKNVISNESVILCDKKTKTSTILSAKKLKSLDWGHDYHYKIDNYSVKVTAIPAYHGNTLISRTLVGKVNGYLLEISTDNQLRTI